MLDTHVLLWLAEGNRKIGRKANRLLHDPETEIWLSAVCVWEIANKASLGRLRLEEPVRDWFQTQILGNSLVELPFNQEHVLAASELPRYHEDPFDRMLIGQAQVEDLRIITADTQFGRYDVRVIDATD